MSDKVPVAEDKKNPHNSTVRKQTPHFFKMSKGFEQTLHQGRHRKNMQVKTWSISLAIRRM